MKNRLKNERSHQVLCFREENYLSYSMEKKKDGIFRRQMRNNLGGEGRR